MDMKTLKDIIPPENEDRPTLFQLQYVANEWIKYLEETQEVHREYLKEKGFDGEEEKFAYAFPYGYDNIIHWIEHFFNLKKE